MSTTTTNLGLVKPEYSDTADVQEINQNMDKVDDAVGAAQNSFAILADGNAHAAILSGQFVYVRNHDTLSEGLYNARAAIPTNGALSTSNLTAVPGGGLNTLMNEINGLSGSVSLVYYSGPYTEGLAEQNIKYKISGKLLIVNGLIKLNSNASLEKGYAAYTGLPIPSKVKPIVGSSRTSNDAAILGGVVITSSSSENNNIIVFYFNKLNGEYVRAGQELVFTIIYPID